ncbi:MAG: KH domain-containing protein [Spirochaetales bacterium]|nr:KH domain-containing protein [Spirochaetales bacterium]
MMKELVEKICKVLVDFPNEVSVAQIDGKQTSILELKVNKADIGKVIGKQGRTAQAIRTIISAAGMKDQRRYNLEILESSSLE